MDNKQDKQGDKNAIKINRSINIANQINKSVITMAYSEAC